jgi:hypothetical protein
MPTVQRIAKQDRNEASLLESLYPGLQFVSYEDRPEPGYRGYVVSSSVRGKSIAFSLPSNRNLLKNQNVLDELNTFYSKHVAFVEGEK